MTISLADQIRCVGRELGMRRATYPKWVASGRMKQAEADVELERMDAVYATLKGLEEAQRPHAPVVCGRPIGAMSCALPAGHDGPHEAQEAFL